MVEHFQVKLTKKSRGFHLITREILQNLPLPESGILYLFIQHTSASLTINENADPDVRHDFELYMNTIVPENLDGMLHTLEGADDMPAHIKSSLLSTSLSIPIINYRLALGIWQGIYLCEHRNGASERNIVATILT